MQWQYLLVRFPTAGFLGDQLQESKLGEGFNNLGKEGWEFVSFMNSSMTHEQKQDVVGVFKRPVEHERSPGSI